MEELITYIKGIDFENFDILGLINAFIGIIKQLLGGFIGDSGEQL